MDHTVTRLVSACRHRATGTLAALSDIFRRRESLSIL
jgi:hypothetical protein